MPRISTRNSNGATATSAMEAGARRRFEREVCVGGWRSLVAGCRVPGAASSTARYRFWRCVRRPRRRLSPAAFDVDPARPLASPIARHPAMSRAARDPASRHPDVLAALPAPIPVGPDVAMRLRRRRPAIASRRRRREARAIGVRPAAGPVIGAGPGRRAIAGRRGLRRCARQPAADAGHGRGQSDGAQPRASIHLRVLFICNRSGPYLSAQLPSSGYGGR